MDSIRRRSLAVAGLVLGFGLVVLALPATVAELMLTVGNPALARVERGLRLTPAGEARLERSRLAARSIERRPSIARDLAVLHFARATSFAQQNDERAAGAFEHAAALFAESLAREPARAEAWSALAWLRLARSGDAGGAAAALRLSYRVAPLRPSLADLRAPLGLLLLDELDAPTRERLARDLRLIARTDEDRLRAFARRFGLEDQLGLILSAGGK
jgi:hypothetical protein